MDQGKASHIAPPRQITSTAVTRVRLYTATTASQCDELPDAWAGHYIRVRAEGGDVDWFVADTSAAAVDRTVAAANAGASSTALGDRLAQYDWDAVVLPKTAGRKNYLVRQGSVSTAALRVTMITE